MLTLRIRRAMGAQRIVHGGPMTPRTRRPAPVPSLIGALALAGGLMACGGGSRSGGPPPAPSPAESGTGASVTAPPSLSLADTRGIAADCIAPQGREGAEPSGAAAVRDTSVRAGASAPRGRPDLVLYAEVSAEEVRFDAQPEIRVSLGGCASLDTVRVLERRNLPRPVVVGQTYRDVFVAVEILGYLEGRCLAERLGARTTAADSARTSGASCAALEAAMRSGSGAPP
jgi:hypothetical protein